MTSCDRQCKICKKAKTQSNRIYCVLYGIPIWGRKGKNEETAARYDQNLRGLRKGNSSDPRMAV